MKKYSLCLAFLLILIPVIFAEDDNPETSIETPADIQQKLSDSFVHVEGGTFQMGSDFAYDNGKPVHKVTLTSFYIAKTEVTQAQWIAVMVDNPSDFSGENLPVENVSWFDAIVFCNKLSMMENKTPVYSIDDKTNPDEWDYTPCCDNSINGKVVMNKDADGYRLPTEAEWEYAARGGKNSKGYEYSGSDDLFSVAWYRSSSESETHEVATKEANELGLYDMSGNVWEWCWDRHGFYHRISLKDPSGPSSGTYRILRGGSWYNPLYYCRVAFRDFYSPDFRDKCTGFRLVCSAK